MARRLVIGIDPGKTTGLAVYDRRAGNFERLESTDFWGAIDFITGELDADEIVKIVIEQPSTKAIYARNKRATARGAIERTGVNVGSALREASLMIDRLRDLGYPVQTVPPLGKIDAKRFKQITGWSGKSNSHTRDAGMMAWRA
jgi:hypothetical protein